MRSKLFIVFVLCSLFFVQATAQELLNYPLDTVNGEEVYRYQVERSIGLYRIGVNFNVPQSEIIRLNPQKVEAKKAVVEEVKETVVPKDTVIPVQLDTVIPADTVVVTTDTVVPADTIIVPDGRRVIELALMLPFESQQTKRSGNAERMMEFYEGALLALHDLQNDSLA